MEKTMLLSFLALTLAVLCAGYGVGEGLLGVARPPRIEPYFRLFLALTLGLAVLTGSYAAVVTRGLTILLPVLALTLLLAFRLRPTAEADQLPLRDAPAEPVWPAPRPWAPLALVGGAALGLFAVRVGLVYDPTSPFLLTPFRDYIYYGRLSFPLNHLGLETRSLEQLYPQFSHPQPYHYFELWLNALLVRLSGLPGLWCLYLVVFPVLTTLVFAGLRALLAHFRWRGAWAAGLAGLLLLLSGVYWPVFESTLFLHNGLYRASSILLLEPKLSAVYIFLLLGLLLLLQRRWPAAGLALAALPLVFFSTLPAVVGGVGALALGLGRWLSRTQWLGLLLPLLLALAYLAAFYGLQPNPYQFPAQPWASVLAALPHPAQWRTVLNLFIGTLGVLAFYFGAYAVVLALVGWGRFRTARQQWTYSGTIVAVLVLACTLVATAASTIADRIVDNWQLMSNLLLPLFTIAIGAVLAALLSGPGTGRRRAAALTALLLLAGVNHRQLFSGPHAMHAPKRFAPAFLRQVGAELSRIGHRGGFVLGESSKDYKSVYDLNPDTYTCGTYVANFATDYLLIPLDAPDADSLAYNWRLRRHLQVAKESVEASSFRRFVRLHAQTGRRWPRDSARYQFVVQKGLRFICLASGAALPATLQPLVQAVYRDELSGERFVVLRSQPGRPQPENRTPQNQ